MDPNVLAQLGVTAALVLAVASIVNPTVNQFKAALLLDSRMTLILAYGLSFLLTVILAFINPIDWTIPMYVLVAKTFVGGWVSAVYAGIIADRQKATDDKMRGLDLDRPPAFLPPLER